MMVQYTRDTTLGDTGSKPWEEQDNKTLANAA